MATVIDGDTVVIGNQHVRLSSIDAPERGTIACLTSFSEFGPIFDFGCHGRRKRPHLAGTEKHDAHCTTKRTRELACTSPIAKRVVAILEERHPDVAVYTPVVDRELNDRKFIVPGLGDFGDRLYGTV